MLKHKLDRFPDLDDLFKFNGHQIFTKPGFPTYTFFHFQIQPLIPELETGVQAVQLETEVTEAQALHDAPAYEWWI